MNSATQNTTTRRSAAACWIEAMRLRTLPVSAAGVVMAAALGVAHGQVRWLPWTLCLIFALLAQIASNFANEYFDFRDGLDRKGRVGPRRGVTEGDISPRAMLTATILTLGIAAAIGCTLIYWGGWWLLAAGIVIVLGALAYSAGPYPLSRHALGEVAVILFFGIVPVTLTYYVISGPVTPAVWFTALSTGLLGANILIVNNYRDIADDKAVGKTTLATIIGPKATLLLYLIDGVAAVGLMMPQWRQMPAGWQSVPELTVTIIVLLWLRIRKAKGAELNPMLGATAMVMLLYALAFLAANIFTN